jgi:putative membrane protein
MKFLASLACLGILLGSAIAAAGADKVSQVFIRDAVQSNLAKIELGKLAQENAQSAEVKSYGQTLVTEHSTSNEQALKVAKQIGINAPTELNVSQKSAYDKIAKLSGRAFERAFVNAIIMDYKTNVMRFKNEAKKKNDPVADFANQTLPLLKKNLEAAEKLKSDI